jgi:hypothetical protein
LFVNCAILMRMSKEGSICSRGEIVSDETMSREGRGQE